jgi:peptidoglycan/LPS O-acetylase OafA/YrhL
MQYNPALDGLRGGAVVLVILFHLDALPGGFIGVDIFFVLSGFLITSLLRSEQERTGSLNVPRFYIHRLLRLGPPLLLLLIVYLAVVPWLFAKMGMRDHVIDAVLVATYLSDYSQAFWSRPRVLPHTWSLSVEEHYYLLWPLVLAPARRLTGRQMIGLLGALYIAATLWRVLLLAQGVEWAEVYARFDTRMSGLILGGLLAVWTQAQAMKRATRDAIGVVGVIVIVAFALLLPYGDPSALTWGLGLVELASAGVILSIASTDGYMRQWMSARALVSIGLVSYALYLWHYPILLATPTEWPAEARRATTIVLSAVAAIASYGLIERPMRKLRHRRRYASSPRPVSA